MTTTTQLLRTPLYDLHLSKNAKMVDFAGWEMPLHYGSIIEEHHQVRRSGGLFDVSHMGRFTLSGRDAGKFLDRICTRSVADMTDGQCRYSIVCNDRGGCHDDVLVYRREEGDFLLVVNASNREKLLAHIEATRKEFVFKFEDITLKSAMVALQGPKVMNFLGQHSSEVVALKRYRFTTKNVFGLEFIVSRTGYTGEDGVEVIFRTDGLIARTAIKMMASEFDRLGDVFRPAGLGARDSLRLEAAMPLYGHEITEELDPLSAGLDFAIKLDKGAPFIGQKALQGIAAAKATRKLVGLELEGRRAARQGMRVLSGEKEIGLVTSGCLSPTLDKSIAMAHVERSCGAEGTLLSVDLGRQQIPCRVVKLPFYKAPS